MRKGRSEPASERTFFRHFADKREVLFAGAGPLQELLVSTVANGPDCVAPMNAVAAALEAAGALLQERRVYARQRQTVIAANAEAGIAVFRIAFARWLEETNHGRA